MRSPECPRCGYDLSGKLEGYRNACPLEDVCSECGCEYRWHNVMGDAACPRWFVENPKRSAWRTLLPTLLRLAVPGRFWRRVMMEYPPRWFRVLAIPVFVYLLCGGLTAGVLGFQAWREMSRPTMNGAAWPADAGIAVAFRVGGGMVFPLGARDTDYYGLEDVLYNIRWAPPPPQGGPAVGWFRRPAHQLVVWQPSVYIFVPMVSSCAMPFMMLVPAATRKRYRVRAWHMWRIGGYGLAGGIAVAFLTVVYMQLLEYRFVLISFRSELWWDAIPLIPLVLTLAWSLAWWWAATRWYLRIPGAFRHVLPLVSAAFLAAFTATFLVLLAVSGPDGAMRVVPWSHHLI